MISNIFSQNEFYCKKEETCWTKTLRDVRQDSRDKRINKILKLKTSICRKCLNVTHAKYVNKQIKNCRPYVVNKVFTIIQVIS